MCGIWGFKVFSGKPNKQIVSNIIKKADMRGGHCNGFYSIDSNSYHTFYKKHGKAEIDFMSSMVMLSDIVIGHSRLATGSDISIFNSQPILSGNKILVHNGIIKNYKDIYNDYNYIPRTDNDSEALIIMIEKNAMPDKYSYLMIEYDDVKYDLKYGNKDLPLYIKQNNGVMYFCSNDF